MWSSEIVEALPLVELRLQIDVALVAEQLVELLLVRAMRTLDLAVQLRGASSDVRVADALVLDVPVELRLELMTVVGPDLPDSKWELIDDVVDEIDGARLGMLLVDLERPHSRYVINGCELEAPDLLAVIAPKRQELDVHLDVVARNLFVVAFGVDLPHSGAARQPVDAIALEHPGDCCIRYLDVVIARQIPDDPYGAEVILAPEMENLLLDFDRRPIGMPLRDRRAVHQARFTVLSIGLAPAVETASANAEISTRLRDVTGHFGMMQNTKLTRDLTLILGHEHLLRPRIGSLIEMSRE